MRCPGSMGPVSTGPPEGGTLSVQPQRVSKNCKLAVRFQAKQCICSLLWMALGVSGLLLRVARGLSYGAGTGRWVRRLELSPSLSPTERKGFLRVPPPDPCSQPSLVHFVSCAQYMMYLHIYSFCLRELSSFSQFIWWQLISLIGAREQGLGSEEGK